MLGYSTASPPHDLCYTREPEPQTSHTLVPISISNSGLYYSFSQLGLLPESANWLDSGRRVELGWG